MDWQPIETAPKDGTAFLAWISGLPYAAKYNEHGRFIWYWHSDTAEGPGHRIHNITLDGEEKRLLEETISRGPAKYEVRGLLWVDGFDDNPTYWTPLNKPPEPTP